MNDVVRYIRRIVREELRETFFGYSRGNRGRHKPTTNVEPEEIDAEVVKDVTATWNNQSAAEKVYKLTQKHGSPDKVTNHLAYWKDIDGKEKTIRDN